MMDQPMGLATRNGEAAVPLKGVRLDARIRDLFCDVTVEQQYENAGRETIEAVYTFPLPLDAVLLDVQVKLGDKQLHGAVVPKAEAERKYETAMAAGDAAIRLERIEPGLYAMNVGNLLAGESAVITIRYGQLLRWTGNDVRFHIPTTLAPRYGVPQMKPYHVPPVSLLAENRFTLGVKVSGLLAVAAIDCPTHRVTTRHANGEVELALSAGQSFMDRDLVVNFKLAEGARSNAVSVAHGKGRVALLSWRPQFPTTVDAPPRAFKIVVDCSGSMNGDSITQAGLALKGILESLRPQDRFDIVRFGSGCQALFGKLRPAAGRDLEQALACAVGLKADMGGTEIGHALHLAYKLKGADPEIRPDLLLITDGQIHDGEPVIEAARASGHRVFTVGVGASVAEAFVRRLASETGGACELVTPNEDMAGRIVRHFHRMNAPRAQDVQIRWPGKPEREVPSRMGAVYDGDTLHAFAWLPDKAAGEARVQLTLENRRTVAEVFSLQSIDEGIAAPSPGHSLARMAAAARIAELSSEAEAQSIALEYQLLTEYTDFLVVHERAESEKAKDLAVLLPVAHMLAAGWGGVGRVAESRMSLFMDVDAGMHRSISYSLGSNMRACPADGNWQELDDGTEMRVSIEKAIEFDYLTGRLKDCNLLMLERGNVPAEIIAALRRLIEQNLDEYQVVLAWLLVSAEKPDDPQFSREAIRAIRKAAAGARIDDELLARVMETPVVVTGRKTSVRELLEDVKLPVKG